MKNQKLMQFASFLSGGCLFAFVYALNSPINWEVITMSLMGLTFSIICMLLLEE